MIIGEVYYSSKCKEECENSVRNMHEGIIVSALQAIIEKIHFTDEELEEIERGRIDGLKHVSQIRNRELDDLHRKKKKYLSDLDYIKTNKVSILREDIMSTVEMREETENLKNILRGIDKKMETYTETEE